jgi:hypothetical protein
MRVSRPCSPWPDGSVHSRNALKLVSGRELRSSAAGVLQPGGIFVHIGVHPCFCGGFADRADPAAIVIRPGYLDGHWTTASWTTHGVRDKVGATHLPLPALLHAFLDAGLSPEQLAEGGGPTPVVLAIKARKLP